MIKKYASLFVLLVSVLAWNGCSKSSQSEKPTTGTTIEKIKAKGKIVAITDYNSINYFIYKGMPMGYQYEMLKSLANHLKVDLELRVNNDLDESFKELKSGDVDVIALNLTVTKERAEEIAFTKPIMQTRQVLVQRKPDEWMRLTNQEINLKVIRNQLNLTDKSIYVQEKSSHAARLKHLSNEIGGHIDIVEVPMVVEELIKLVADGDIDYTVCDENIALVNQTYYPNIDIQTAISFPQNIAWALNPNSNDLVDEINKWLTQYQKTLKYTLLYKKYFENKKSAIRKKSEYYTVSSGKISPFDSYIKMQSSLISWDWRLLASLIYQESKFDNSVQSWAGAYGLMQLMPTTAEQFGATLESSPEENINAGVKFLAWLDNSLKDTVPDANERMKFILASYNVGLGHVLDARRLALKYGKDPNVWQDNVDYFLLNKSKPGFYQDPVVKYGYCRGEEPYYYVLEILDRYDHYKNLVKEAV